MEYEYLLAWIDDRTEARCRICDREWKETVPVGRTNDFQPARTFYLYHVDLPRTVRGLVEYTCKLVRNLVLRQRHGRSDNKAVLDKDAAVQPIVENIRSSDLDEASKLAQIAEVEEMYLPGPDRAQLNRFRKAQAALLAAQDQSIRVLLIFKLFLASGQT
uniref:DNA-directed RNA polymerase III subunit RPC3 n=1 Tax=Caenorhabditis japonica TaxID=281687 RepID=A0A8R1E610_CAEJA